jgi:hypothetical protein
MNKLTTGTGLSLLAGAIVAYPFLNRLSSMGQSAHALPPMNAVSAVAPASAAQAAPTIVWYGTMPGFGVGSGVTFYALLFRAWSDGTVEAKAIAPPYAGNPNNCEYSWSQCGWRIVSAPNQGFSAAADLDFNGKVDGADLGQILASWGDAPRHDIPPSDCPLNLINPR